MVCNEVVAPFPPLQVPPDLFGGNLIFRDFERSNGFRGSSKVPDEVPGVESFSRGGHSSGEMDKKGGI